MQNNIYLRMLITKIFPFFSVFFFLPQSWHTATSIRTLAKMADAAYRSPRMMAVIAANANRAIWAKIVRF